MNANELADELLAVVNVSSHVKMCASDMLRRQQAEIEALKSQLNTYKVITDTKIEPTVVSYTHPAKEEAEQQSHQEDDGCPAELAVLKRFWRSHQTKFSDEEIKELAEKHLGVFTEYGCCNANVEGEIEFARAILRKAQEK